MPRRSPSSRASTSSRSTRRRSSTDRSRACCARSIRTRRSSIRGQYAQMRERQEGHYYGIGISIAAVDGDITVTQLFEGSPAYRAGIRRGDVIAFVPCVAGDGSAMTAAGAAQSSTGKDNKDNTKGWQHRPGRQAHQGPQGHDGRYLDPPRRARSADRPHGRARRDQHHHAAHGVHDRAGHRLRAPPGILRDDGHRAQRRAQEAEGRGHAAAAPRHP